MASVPTEDLSRTLSELAQGRELRQTDLDGLMALGRQSARVLREHWSALPDPTRMTIAAYMQERSRQDIAGDYDAAALVALDDPLPVIRRFAAETLWESTGREVGERLLRAFQHDPDDAVRAIAARLLAGFVLEREFGRGDLAWGDELVSALHLAIANDQTSLEIRSSALISVAPRTEAWVQSALREAYYADERDYRLACVVAMGLTAQPMWLDYLYEQLQSEDPDFRKAAATACGEIADEDAVDPLGDTLDDEDPFVVAAAVAALAEIGGELAMEYLQEFRRRVPEELADTVEEAIVIAREAEAADDEDEDW